jgi:hypothetical protein
MPSGPRRTPETGSFLTNGLPPPEEVVTTTSPPPITASVRTVWEENVSSETRLFSSPFADSRESEVEDMVTLLPRRFRTIIISSVVRMWDGSSPSGRVSW